MGFGSPIHWIILGIIAIVLFGGGRFPSLMGDVASGLKSFKKGMAEEDEAAPAPLLSRPETEGAPQPAREVHVSAPIVEER